MSLSPAAAILIGCCAFLAVCAELGDYLAIMRMILRLNKCRESTPEESPILAAFDLDGNGFMEFDEYTTTTKPLVRLLPQLTAVWTESESVRMENRVNHVMASSFAMTDSNADGKATAAELDNACFIRWVSNMQYGSQGIFKPAGVCVIAAAECGGYIPTAYPSVSTRASLGFKLQDEDGNGEITIDEMENTYFVAMVYLSQNYAKYKFATQLELCAKMAAKTKRATVESTFAMIDSQNATTHDGVIKFGEYETYVKHFFPN